jgi:phytoene dehydrogenase-like protein
MAAVSSAAKYDVIVIGGGHNGLTNAAYSGEGGKESAGA